MKINNCGCDFSQALTGTKLGSCHWVSHQLGCYIFPSIMTGSRCPCQHTALDKSNISNPWLCPHLYLMPNFLLSKKLDRADPWKKLTFMRPNSEVKDLGSWNPSTQSVSQTVIYKYISILGHLICTFRIFRTICTTCVNIFVTFSSFLRFHSWDFFSCDQLWFSE